MYVNYETSYELSCNSATKGNRNVFLIRLPEAKTIVEEIEPKTSGSSCVILLVCVCRVNTELSISVIEIAFMCCIFT